MLLLLELGLDVRILSESKEFAIEILHSDGFWWSGTALSRNVKGLRLSPRMCYCVTAQ